ncbi:GEVED domain-containing protein [Corallibacter sp.]|uniref:GEVED domain-containing protein n=1 Tax=Corallibacter sp. TaxID=2038084 RepID=UPI003AB3B015
MKKNFTLSIVFFLMLASVFAQERKCATMENLEQRKQQNPELERKMQEIEDFTQAKIQQMSTEMNRIDGSIITLPVVVHVLYRNSTENISVAQIQSQIDVLNEDFGRTNADADNTWSQAADTEIQFCLATVDPNGNTTTGITRKSTTRQDWGTSDDMKKTSQGGVDPWDTSQYLNMWIVPKMTDSGRTILGYAQFPGGSASTDGVVMAYNYFGRTGAVSAPFDLGRTTTHEVGHFLNLRHIWGDGPCGYDDFVSDTPASDAANYGCATGHTSCSSTDMVQNYMDYSDDSCMNLFTLGQKNRMRAVLEAGGARRSLALSDKCGGGGTTPTCSDGIQNGDETGVDCGGSSCQPCQTGVQYCDSQGNNVNDEYISRVQLGTINNPSGAQFYSDFTSTATDLSKNDTYTVTVTPTWTGTVYNEGYAVWVDYNQDGDFTDSGEQVWTRSATTTTPVSGNFTVPNSVLEGETRMRVSMKYNGIPSSCEAFSYGEVEDYTVNIVNGGSSGGDTTVTLTLNFDNYPEETSWSILSGGSTVALGGTYGSQADGSTLSIDVDLPAGCYSLVMNDAYGDGMCCSYGNGSYALTDGGTTLASGGSFSSSQTTNFCVGGASREAGTIVASVYDDIFKIYPNPAKQTLNVSLNGLEAQSYKVINMLGQVVLSGSYTDAINVSELNNGMYMIQLQIGEKTKTKRFIKE